MADFGRDEAAAKSPLSDASSRVILRGAVRGFAIDDAVGAAYEGRPDNTGPEVTRPNDRAGRSCLSPTKLEADSRTGYALSEREREDRVSGEFKEIGDGGFLRSLGPTSSGGVGGV